MQAVKVEQLKRRLLSALDEEKQVTNVKAAGDAILLIERTTLTKESLEASRLGLLINEVRRKNQSHFPDFARRCRALIKEWQKLISSTSATTADQQLNCKQQQQHPVEQYPVNKCHASGGYEQRSQKLVTDKHKSNNVVLESLSSPRPPVVDVAMTLAATVAPLYKENSNNNKNKNNGIVSIDDEPSQLKIRIKLGRSEEASIVKTVDQQQAPVNRSRDQVDLVGIEQAENRRKRKHTIGSERSSHGVTVAPSIGGLGLNLNGEVTPKANGTLKASSSSSGGGSVSDDGSSTMGAGGAAAAAAAAANEEADGCGGAQGGGRLPKLKSTAALVAEMTKSYPDTVAVHIDEENEEYIDDEDQQGARNATMIAGDHQSTAAAIAEETRSLASSSAATTTTGLLLLRGGHQQHHQQTTTDFVLDSRGRSELMETKCAMLRRFLDNIDSQVASPPFAHDQPHQPSLDGWSKINNGDGWSSTAASTSTSRSSSPSAANVSISRQPPSMAADSPPLPTPTVGIEKGSTLVLCSDMVDWQAMLPSLDDLKNVVDEDGVVVEGPLEEEEGTETDGCRRCRHRLRRREQLVESHLLLDDCSTKLSNDQLRFRDLNDDDEGNSATSSNVVRGRRVSLEQSFRHCDRFIALHSRVLTKLRNGRQVLAMPYVDIGIPDFLEYGFRDVDNFVVSRSEVGW